MRIRWTKDWNYDQRDAKGNLLRSFQGEEGASDSVIRELGEAAVAAGVAEEITEAAAESEAKRAKRGG
ncbi:MAG: hypothetical protein H0W34_01050 [Pyrinomonadaceae bacterium]|nr:hypothetical protein [Pyrinomonadaceae bacterium]